MNKTLLAGTIAATALTLAACGEDFKGPESAIDHCKNIAAEKADYATYPKFNSMKAESLGDENWSVTGRAEYTDNYAGQVTKNVTCTVWFDKGMSDNADVRATLS